MSAPEPLILYWPVVGSNAAEPLMVGSPTSSELVKAPNGPACAKAETARVQASKSLYTSRLYMKVLRFEQSETL